MLNRCRPAWGGRASPGLCIPIGGRTRIHGAGDSCCRQEQKRLQFRIAHELNGAHCFAVGPQMAWRPERLTNRIRRCLIRIGSEDVAIVPTFYLVAVMSNAEPPPCFARCAIIGERLGRVVDGIVVGPVDDGRFLILSKICFEIRILPETILIQINFIPNPHFDIIYGPRNAIECWIFLSFLADVATIEIWPKLLGIKPFKVRQGHAPR